MAEMDPKARSAIIASFFIIVKASLTQAGGVPPVARPKQARARCTLPPPNGKSSAVAATDSVAIVELEPEVAPRLQDAHAFGRVAEIGAAGEVEVLAAGPVAPSSR